MAWQVLQPLDGLPPWLAGALCSIIGSCVGLIGVLLQKKAQHRCADDRILRRKQQKQKKSPGEDDTALPVGREVLSQPKWWIGLVLLAVHYPITTLALTYAPETTVVPLGATQVLLNFIMAYAFLHEVFNRKDMWATVMCIVGMAIAMANMPQGNGDFLNNFPTHEFLRFINSFFTGSLRDEHEAFEIYMVVWVVLVFACIYTMKSVHIAKAPFALPMLVGLFSAAFHFAAKIAGTLYVRTIWGPTTYWVYSSTAFLYVITVMVTSFAVLRLDCRFFVPTSFAVSSVAVMVQAVFFFREWQLMSYTKLVAWEVGCVLSLVSTFFISPKHVRVKMGPPSSPLLPPKDYEEYHRKAAVLAIMEEHRMFSTRTGAAPLQVIELETPETAGWRLLRAIWRLVPMLACVVPVLACAALLERSDTFACFVVLTLWSSYNSWKFGLHMVVFSYVGQRKMAQYAQVDFDELNEMHPVDRNADPQWKDIRHFVVLPNYKEDVEVLRLAIRSVAQSSLAKAQICLCLAMEEREEGSAEKALALKREFQDKFWDFIFTLHPPDLPNETAGKSSNCKWATDQIMTDEIAKRGLKDENVVLTVGDADSEFHGQYFSCLTFNYIRGGANECDTPDRFLSIYQAPILHYKNYLAQPHVVRLAGLFTCQHELANLADPNACRVPYSTYSISVVLAKGVRGWDPDWISEDWHMGMKCFLATAGRLRIQPIFLGIMNYAPEGSSTTQTLEARWTQGKRHALGFSELVFFLDHFPRVLRVIQGGWAKAVFVWRAVFLWTRCLMIHLTMACMLPVLITTALLAYNFFRHNQTEDVNSWTFLTFIVFQFTGIVSTVLFMFTNVLLFEVVLERVDGFQNPAALPFVFRYRGAHFLWSAFCYFVWLPIFFLVGGSVEWIAAFKTARTHKFKYDVALKPKIGNSDGNATGDNANNA